MLGKGGLEPSSPFSKDSEKPSFTTVKRLRIRKLPAKKTPKVSRESLGEPDDIKTLVAEELEYQAIDVEHGRIPQLAYGLDRVLFNPGIYRLRDPRTQVYNFDPYLQKLMPVKEFDFHALHRYLTSSKDETLLEIARRHNVRFTGSTSSLSSALKQFHFLLSSFRPLNHGFLSRSFPDPIDKMTQTTLAPPSIFLRYRHGRYAIDTDGEHDDATLMSFLGQSMEKLLTTSKETFERYRRSSAQQRPEASRNSYHYSRQGGFLVRSQLDAQDSRLPGTGVFDVKTRAVVTVRLQSDEVDAGNSYQLLHEDGLWQSFERELYDLSRSTMIKYALQARMGRMDGIFMAYHNTQEIFGFQYLSLADMDRILFGTTDPRLGDQEFKASLHLLEEVLQRATEKYPETVCGHTAAS